jgi:flagellar hook-length control protein FliK
MSLASDISAPAALSPVMTAAPAATPERVAAGEDFAVALTQAQTSDAPEAALPVAPPAQPAAAVLPEVTAEVPQGIGADAVVAHRQSFVPVHGMVEFPAAANIDASPLLAQPVTPATGPLPEPVEAEAQSVAVDAAPVSKPAAKGAAAKPGVAKAEDRAVDTEEMPPAVTAVPLPVTQALPVEPPTAPADGLQPVGAKGMAQAQALAQGAALPSAPDAEPATFDASLTAAVPETSAPPAGDLRAALAGLQRLEDKDVPADAVPQPLADAPAATLEAQDEAAAITGTAPDSAVDPSQADSALVVTDATLQNQPAAPVITVQVAPLVDASAPLSAPVHPTLRMDQPDWPEKLAIRLAGAFDANEANIEMQLSPEHLGPLHIRLEMKSGMAQVFVTTATPQAAEAFARAEGQLSGLLAASEVTLTGQETAQGGFADHGAQGGYHGFHGQPAARFAQPDTARSTAAKPGPSQLLNLIA